MCNVQLTFVDLAILVVWDMLEFFPFLHFPELLAAHPTLVVHRKHISELPRVKEYLAKRPPPSEPAVASVPNTLALRSKVEIRSEFLLEIALVGLSHSFTLYFSFLI